MAEEEAPLAHPSTPERVHEHSDVSLSAAVKVGLWSLGAAVVIHVGLWGLFVLFQRQAQSPEEWRPVSAVRQVRAVPEPRLQGIPGFHPRTPQEDLEDLRRREEEILQSYGRGQEPGHARIPLGRARDFVLERGLPSWGKPAAPAEGKDGKEGKR